MKPFLLYRAPVKSISGYGAHSRDILKSLYDLNLFNIKIDSCPWGMTPMSALNEQTDFNKWILDNIVDKVSVQPDIYIQVTIPSEFMPLGKFSIGITAGIETTVMPKTWIDGCNRMNLIITTSKFSKSVFENTMYNETEKQTNKLVRVHKVEKPIEVLFEGCDTKIFSKVSRHTKINDKINQIDSNFCFLFVGHWLKGITGQDRKDVGMLIKCFAEAFKGEENQPALILKTSLATFSVKERENIRKRILDLVSSIDNAPPIYFLFGELSEFEMNDLYNHKKVKAMVTITKGEGFCRPLLEFTMSGKPVIASNWSGHLDFLKADRAILLSGSVNPIHESTIDDNLIKDSKWFTVDYDYFVQVLKHFKNNYDVFTEKSEKLRQENNENFSMEKMTLKLSEILETYVDIENNNDYELKMPELIK